MASAGGEVGKRVVIRGARSRMLVFALVFFGAVFVFNIVRAATGTSVAWFSFVGSGGLTAAAAVSLLLPPRLEIDGPTVSLSAFGVIHRSWDLRLCGPFVQQDSHLGPFTIGTTIAFRYDVPGGPAGALSRRNLAKRGTNAGIPSQFELSPRELTELLNERRDRVVTG